MAESSSSSVANEFLKGFVWGFVAFVHFSVVTVLIYRFALNCLPARFVQSLACEPAGSAKCAAACEASSDLMFYVLAGGTALAAVLIPLGFGIFWVIRFRESR